jgi:ATP-dependent RNA helicase DDX49/DBP8
MDTSLATTTSIDMALTDVSRKRRKIEVESRLASAVVTNGRSSSSSGLFLDDDAVRRSMLDMMAAKRSRGEGEGGETEEDEGTDSSGDEDDEESEAGGDKGEDGEQAVEAAAASHQDDELSSEEDTTAINPPVHSRIPLRRTNRTVDKSQAALERSFESLGVLPPLISALRSISITKPTEIQSACIGPILSGEWTCS